MNNFAVDNFVITKITFCSCVEKGTGAKSHRNRSSHGLVYNLANAKKYVFLNGEEIEICKDEILYLPKFSDYNVENQFENGNCYAVNFDLIDSEITYPPFKIKALAGKKYLADFEKIIGAWNTDKNGHSNKAFSILYNIIYNIQQDMPKKYLQSKKVQIATDGADYISSHLDDTNLSVNLLASKFKITPEYFRALFKDVYGTSPKNYIINSRIEKAKKLLLSKEINITGITKMCGFESTSYFDKIFKNKVGCSPSNYVSSLANNISVYS